MTFGSDTAIFTGPLALHACSTQITNAFETDRSNGAMPSITFIEHDGTKHAVEAKNGQTAMEAAIGNTVPGIVAECGGACSCATCHVYVDETWTEQVGGPSEMEEDMLDFAFDVRPTSRLSCQIRVSDALDGLVLHIPEEQV